MPLHLLGKKSWNVYNPAAIARVKADEATAAAREAAEEQRMQELDAERRSAILRGQTPPPLPEEETSRSSDKRANRDKDGHDRKRRRLAGEDDTDRDLRLAKEITGPKERDTVAALKLRQPKNEAPLTDHAGHINLFPVDLKEAGRREKNAEVEKEKKRKEKSYEDQYTMRFSNAAGNSGTAAQPWYATVEPKRREHHTASDDKALVLSGFEGKDVWGREDPRRKEREQARITSNDPLAFMSKAQVQLKKSREDRKRWAEERDREIRELRAAEERGSRKDRHGKRKRHREHDLDKEPLDGGRREKKSSSSRHHHHRSRSRERHKDRPLSSRHSHGQISHRRRSRSRSREKH